MPLDHRAELLISKAGTSGFGKEAWTGQSGSSSLGLSGPGVPLLGTAGPGWVSCFIVPYTAPTAGKASVLTLPVLPVPLP